MAEQRLRPCPQFKIARGGLYDREPKVIAIDIETYNRQGRTALDPFTSMIRCMSTNDGESLRWFDLKEPYLLGTIPPGLRKVLEDPTVVKLAHNMNFEYMFILRLLGIKIQNFWCTYIAERMLVNGLPVNYGYADVVARRCGYEVDKTLQKCDWGGELGPEHVQYSAIDVVFLLDIFKQQYAEMQLQPELFKLFQMEMALLPHTVDMQLQGVHFDLAQVEVLRKAKVKEAEELLAELQKELPWVPLTATELKTKKARAMYPDLVKPVSNINDFKAAYKALGVVLPKKKTKNPKTGVMEWKESLSKDVIAKVAHPTAPKYGELQKLNKLISSYLNKIPDWQNPTTGRCHPSINQVGAETGRPSMDEPALQTVPNTTEMRRTVKPQDEENYLLVKADYSQLELRLAAVCYNDKNMFHAYTVGIDLHKQTASEMFKVPYEEVTGKQRKGAKGVNFGSIYGQTPKGLQTYIARPIYGMNATVEECKSWLDAFFKLWPGIKQYHTKIMSDCYEAKQRGETYVSSNLVGRTRRWLPDQIQVMEFDSFYGGAKKRIPIVNDVINHPVQSTASEFMKAAVIVVNQLFQQYNLTRTKLILMVHDELVAESHKDEARIAAVLMYKGMRYAAEEIVLKGIPMPIEVEVSIGRNWGDTVQVLPHAA